MKSHLPIESAPKNNTIVQLLVEFSENSLEDTGEPVWTIGHNGFEHNEIDEWQFAGWCWTHDMYTEGKGKVIGWLPFDHPELPSSVLMEINNLPGKDCLIVLQPKTAEFGADFEKGVVLSVQMALNAGQETLAREILGSCGITPQSDLSQCAEYDLKVLRSHLPEFVDIAKGVE